MPMFRRRSTPTGAEGPPPEDLVRDYLRGQNLEQVQDTDGAIEHYERAVQAGFDAAGPYDRLIYLYLAREAHADVVRVAEAAISSVRTFDDKRAWFVQMRDEAYEALRRPPDQRGAEF